MQFLGPFRNYFLGDYYDSELFCEVSRFRSNHL